MRLNMQRRSVVHLITLILVRLFKYFINQSFDRGIFARYAGNEARVLRSMAHFQRALNRPNYFAILH